MNPIMSLFGNFQNFQNQFSVFQKQMSGVDPKQKVQELLNSGQMTQEQFNNLRLFANQITGKHM